MKLFGGGRAHGGTGDKRCSAIGQWLRIPRNRKIAVGVGIGVGVCLLLVLFLAWFMKPPAVVPEDLSLADGSQPSLTDESHVDGKYTFLVCATDIDGTRTDSIMVASFDTGSKAINVVNIPRDTMSNVERTGSRKKINAAYGTKQGIVATRAEIKQLLGFMPDKYIVMSFDAIVQVIDAVGGVDYTVPFRMKYDDPVQNLHIDFEEGFQHLDGQQVVEFLRWRKNNSSVGQPKGTYGSDEGRIEKQQEFLKYLAGQVLTVKNTAKLPKIVSAITSNVKTDFSARELLWFGKEAIGINTANINMMTLPGYAEYAYGGSRLQHSYFFPNRDEVLEMVNTYFNPYNYPITSIDIVSGPDKKSSSGSSGNTGKNEEKAKEPDTKDEPEKNSEPAQKPNEQPTQPEQGADQSPTEPAQESPVQPTPEQPAVETPPEAPTETPVAPATPSTDPEG